MFDRHGTGMDERLHGCAGATVFHTSAWMRVLADSYGFEPLYRMHGDGNDAALLPLMDVRSALTGRRGVSLPFTDTVPVIGSRAEVGDMVQAILVEGRKRHWKTVQFRGGTPFGECVPSACHLQHVLDLTPSQESLFAGFTGSVRRGIRKAEMMNAHISVARNEEAVRHFCRLNAHTRRMHGLPPQPGRFFRNVRRHLLDRDRGFVVLAWLDGRAAAAAMFLHFDGKAVFKYGASDKRFQSARVNNAVMWKGILTCLEVGCRSLSMGRTEPGNEGLLRFKRGWGAAESDLPYFTYDLEQKAIIPEQDRLHGMHNALFRMLPLPLLRLVGRVLYRHAA